MPTFSELVLPEFDDEMARTRTVLAAITDDKLNFKLGEEFQTISWNASHIAQLVGWTNSIIDDDFFDIAPVDGPTDDVTPLESSEQILKEFDKNVASARIAIANATDETLAQNWSLKMGGQILFTIPKGTSVRKWVLNHAIHHRGILTIQLRKAGTALTPVYDG